MQDNTPRITKRFFCRLEIHTVFDKIFRFLALVPYKLHGINMEKYGFLSINEGLA